MNSNPSVWTQERGERLKVLWGKGLSASQIAWEIGCGTRMAVIGKARRLGLAYRAQRPTMARLPRRPTKPKPKPQAKPKPAPQPEPAAQPAAERYSRSGRKVKDNSRYRIN